MVFKTNYHLMQVKSIAECSKGTIKVGQIWNSDVEDISKVNDNHEVFTKKKIPPPVLLNSFKQYCQNFTGKLN